MRRVLLAGMLLLAVHGSVFADGFSLSSLNPFMLLVDKDATKFATKMAAGIQNRAECQKFKDEIMSHAKGSPTDGRVVGPIGMARERAKAAGCVQ